MPEPLPGDELLANDRDALLHDMRDISELPRTPGGCPDPQAPAAASSLAEYWWQRSRPIRWRPPS